MNFWKKSIAGLSLGFGLMAPSSCVPPVDAAISCSNPNQPRGAVYWNQVLPDGRRWVQFGALDPDFPAHWIRAYRNNSTIVYASTSGGYIDLVLPKGIGTIKFTHPNYTTCGSFSQVPVLWQVTN